MPSLHDASCRGNALETRNLLAKGFDVNERDRNGATPMFYACNRGHVTVVRLLLDSGVEVNQPLDRAEHNTPLHIACLAGRLDMAQLLLDRGASVDRAINDGRTTALHYACYRRRVEVIQLLLEHGASLHIHNKPTHTFTAPITAILQRWSVATPARQEAVRRHSWEYIEAASPWHASRHDALTA